MIFVADLLFQLFVPIVPFGIERIEMKLVLGAKLRLLFFKAAQKNVQGLLVLQQPRDGEIVAPDTEIFFAESRKILLRLRINSPFFEDVPEKRKHADDVFEIFQRLLRGLLRTRGRLLVPAIKIAIAIGKLHVLRVRIQNAGKGNVLRHDKMFPERRVMGQALAEKGEIVHLIPHDVPIKQGAALGQKSFVHLRSVHGRYGPGQAARNVGIVSPPVFVCFHNVAEDKIRLFLLRAMDERTVKIAGNVVVAVRKGKPFPPRRGDAAQPCGKKPPVFFVFHDFDARIARRIGGQDLLAPVRAGIVYTDYFHVAVTLRQKAVQATFQPFFRIVHGNDDGEKFPAVIFFHL